MCDSIWSSRLTYSERSMACGLTAAMRACSDQLACTNLVGSSRCASAAAAMSARISRISAMSAGDACQSASSISNGSSASRIRTASATEVRRYPVRVGVGDHPHHVRVFDRPLTVGREEPVRRPKLGVRGKAKEQR